ncbi:MAG: hypothetical protein QOH97_1485 [Actinoplanes sp.]|jgi:hypothetical protein|nr:hypothetical protein [Actinoplanes sp.]
MAFGETRTIEVGTVAAVAAVALAQCLADADLDRAVEGTPLE